MLVSDVASQIPDAHTLVADVQDGNQITPDNQRVRRPDLLPVRFRECGHIAVRRRRTVRFVRADQMFRTLKAARLDNSVEAEMRALACVEVLILDDLALQAMHATDTSDFYELIVERHQKTSTIVTSNRDPSEWIAVMSDPLLAQSAVDRLVSTSYELVIEGESYRRRQRPQASNPNNASR